MNYLIHYYVNGNPTYQNVAAPDIPKAIEDIEDDEKPDAVFIESIFEEDENDVYNLREKLRDEHEADLRNEAILKKQ